MSPSSPSATSEQHYLQENFKTLLQLCPKTVSIPRLQSYDDEYMKKERECRGGRWEHFLRGGVFYHRYYLELLMLGDDK